MQFGERNEQNLISTYPLTVTLTQTLILQRAWSSKYVSMEEKERKRVSSSKSKSNNLIREANSENSMWLWVPFKKESLLVFLRKLYFYQ